MTSSEPTPDTARTHYVVDELGSVDELRGMFPLGEADDLNWVFCSTSGVHGSSRTLTDVESAFRAGTVDDLDDGGPFVTVLVVQPRRVCSLYGELRVAPEDIAFLRGLVRTTLVAVARSQAGSL